MTEHSLTDSDFPTIDEVKYYKIALKKCDCAIFTKYIPLIFIRNPKKIKLGTLQFASGMGLIFFRLGAEDKARKLKNLYSEMELDYINFMTAGSGALSEPNDARLKEKVSKSMCKDLFIPTGIEPHDGCEYVLMHKGLKHLALFEYSLPIEFINNPLKIELNRLDYKNGQGVIYYLHGYEFSAKELRKELNRTTNHYDEDHIRRVGRFLGYHISDIEQFVEYCRDRRKFYAR